VSGDAGDQATCHRQQTSSWQRGHRSIMVCEKKMALAPSWRWHRFGAALGNVSASTWGKNSGREIAHLWQHIK
jgi:hypothetical protein